MYYMYMSVARLNPSSDYRDLFSLYSVTSSMSSGHDVSVFHVNHLVQTDVQ